MKHPKIKHTVLCNFILILPVFIIPLSIISGIIFDSVIFLYLFPASSVLLLVYLFKNFAFLMYSDITFKTIKAKKKDFTEFRTDKNGKTKAEIEQRMLMRCEAFGKKENPLNKGIQPVCLVHKAVQSIDANYSVINKNIALFSLDELTKDNLDEVLKNAGTQLKSVANSNDKMRFFKTKEEKKAPACRADIAIILADSVDEYVKNAVRDKSVSNDNDCFLPCVVDCTNGMYYFDSMKEPFEQGLMPKPPKNYAISAANKILFSGRPPYKTSSRAVNSEDLEVLNMSLWDFYKDFKKDLDDSDRDMLKKTRRYLNALDEGEIKIDDDTVYLKQNGQIFTFTLFADEDNEKKVLLMIDDACYTLGKNKYPRKKLAKKIEKNAALDYAADKLKNQGYKVEFDEE